MSIVGNLRKLVKSTNSQVPVSRETSIPVKSRKKKKVQEAQILRPSLTPLTEAPDDEPGGFGGFDEDTDADNEDMDFSLDFAEEDMDEETGTDQTAGIDDGHSSFEETYPEVNPKEAIYTTYNEWLNLAKSKQFYKTIAYYYDEFQKGNLNFISRDFLWKFAKSVSSAITHLFIEAEQKSEAIILVETYYDSLVDCMNSIVYARDAEDIQTIFLYMVDFLGIAQEEDESSQSSGEEDEGGMF